VTFREGSDRDRVGLLLDDRVFDLNAASWDGPTPTSMRELIGRPGWRQEVARKQADAGAGSLDDGLPLDAVNLRAPVPEPSKVIAIGANTWSHLKESAQFTAAQPSSRPLLIGKAPSSVIGDGKAIPKPADTGQLDYEVELGVIIGRTARAVSVNDAFDVVAGYTVTNDVTARDIQLQDREASALYVQHFLSKSCDGFCPAGPALVTTEEVEDVRALTLETRVNGAVRQNSDVSDLVVPVEELVAFTTRYMTLLPGDLILTGSPAGVGYFMDPPSFLEPGDVVTCSVGGIGSVTNPIIDASG
jgi:2-keto-4-pentenoate hydratase/2-oxohepta-3-ene-1,7-dioic acid hydratase in catechol pathway